MGIALFFDEPIYFKNLNLQTFLTPNSMFR
jgi:hypothetical protein